MNKKQNRTSATCGQAIVQRKLLPQSRRLTRFPLHCHFPGQLVAGALLCLGLLIATPPALAWSRPHGIIARVACESLPAWQQQILKNDTDMFANRYCSYPDDASAEDAKPFIMPNPPGTDSMTAILHNPAGRDQNGLVFEYYVPRIVQAFEAGKTTEGMRWFGALTHYLEDSMAPAHVAYGQSTFPDGSSIISQLDFFMRYMPDSDRIKPGTLHGILDDPPFTIDELRAAVKGYQPKLLGRGPMDIQFALAEEHQRRYENSNKHTIPMIMAVANDDKRALIDHGVACATNAIELVADALYTFLCAANNRFTPQERAELAKDIELADFTPISGQVFRWGVKNYNGRFFRNASGGIGEDRYPAKLGLYPLKLKMPGDTVRTFAKGFGVGAETKYTFILPPGAFGTFRVWVGNHAEIGTKGTSKYEVLLDGKVVVSSDWIEGVVTPAQLLEVPLGDARRLTFHTTGKGDYVMGNVHAVWAEPMLTRRPSTESKVK